VAQSEPSLEKEYGVGVGFAILLWAAILAYLPSYLSFTGHWFATVVYVLAGVLGLGGLVGSIYEVSKLWSFRIGKLNENVAVAFFLAGLAVALHFLAGIIPWVWLAYVVKLVAVVLVALAAIGFAFSTEDAIRATVTNRSDGKRTRIANGIKTAAAFLVGLLSAVAAAAEIWKALR
jgi:hypothetical protein